jgi:hypothetical protein
MELTRGVRPEPQRIVIYGPEGIGKTTLAAQMPDPVFIDVEGSTSDMDVIRSPVPSSWRSLVDTVEAFARDHHGRQTLVIDTADWAEKLCISHVCAANNMTSLGGQEDYGRSYNLLEAEWRRFLDSLSRVAASGMHVCLTAHTGIRNHKQPDLEKGYDRWELKMEKKTSAATKEWARTVLFLNYKTYIVEGKDKKKTATGGHRVIYTSHTPAWDAKNRAGLPDELRLEYPAIAGLFSDATATRPQSTQTQQPQPQQQPVTHTVTSEAPPPPAASVASQGAAFLKPLRDLMQRDGVTETEVQLAVAKRGYYPADTPMDNYDPQFVAGKLVAYWDSVRGIIEAVRKEAAV